MCFFVSPKPVQLGERLATADFLTDVLFGTVTESVSVHFLGSREILAAILK